MAAKAFLKTILITSLFFVVFAVYENAHAKIIYVDDDAAGANNGSSWIDAYNYLQDALVAAASGDEIRVAQGVYKPDQGAGITLGDREATFQLINEVTIKGGYAGAGTPDPNSRDIDLYETILSGDLVGDDGPALFEDFIMCCIGFNEPPIPFLKANNYSENSYHVVTGNGTDETAVLDGLTVTAGNAETYPNDYGGGIYNYCGIPTLKKCKMIANFAGRYGGAMYNEESSPTLDNCKFYDNSVIGIYDGGGGGMYNHHSNPTMTNCTFEQNWVYVYQWELYADGGGMCNVASSPTLVNCTFSYNSAMEGGGMSNHFSDPTLRDCMFTGNASDYSGGGMNNNNSSPKLTNCTFDRNTACSAGGGMDNSGQCDPAIIECIFSHNSVLGSPGLSGRGGGMATYSGNRESTPTLRRCVFVGNLVVYGDGGGMSNYAADGGLCNPRLTHCIFSGNAVVGALSRGGGMANSMSNPILSNCTFNGNRADEGAGMHNRSGSVPKLTNCILWGNLPEEIEWDVIAPLISYSDIQGEDEDNHNINADPCFVEPGHWEPNCLSGDDYYHCTYDWIDGDYHLLPDSPCIDSGDPNYVAQPDETDLDGNPRVMAGRIDMGAYESPIFVETRILPRTINLASEGNWITSYIWLPEGYDVAEIEPNSVLLNNEIQPEQFSIDHQQQLATAVFNRQDIQTILVVGDISMKITGRLTNGIVFEAMDTIKVINKAGKN